MSTLSNFEMVGIFHKEFGHPVFTEPRSNVFDEDEKLVKFRLDRIEEELNELKVAKDNDDFLEVVDAVCDTMYFIYGTFHVFGVNFDLQEKQKTRTFDSPQNYCDIFKRDNNGLNRQITMLEQYFSLLTVSCEDKEFNDVLLYLCKMEAQCRSLGNLLGVNIDDCFAEVHRANMTKACVTEEIAQESVQDYMNKKIKRDNDVSSAETQEEKEKIMKTHAVYEDPSYRLSNLTGLWIVYDKATSKILKSIRVEKPNLAKVIDFDNIKNKKNNQQSEELSPNDFSSSNLADTDSNENDTLQVA
jgi:predicted HAD superfamily Cof-like phosphohydrolase